ncbi:hypothetical protein [Nocardia tengchongensis]|uniref:hypothetical protein n=1 Tax=Nocardia tengchongensis TaxID=2055889 RepID=UPI00361E83AF
MTTVDEAPDDSRQEYGWGLAPSHLKTRRQLREMGKSPGQSLVALMVGKVRGRRVVASLFDPDLAPAKRVPTDAQLAAIRKATTEHQLRAAQRRGFSRAEMSAPVEPAPGWEQDHKEGNTVSNKNFQEQPRSRYAVEADELQQRLDAITAILDRAPDDREFDEALDRQDPHANSEKSEASYTAYIQGMEQEERAARANLDRYLTDNRVFLLTDPYWGAQLPEQDTAGRTAGAAEAPAEGVPLPVGHGQRMAFLLATVAVNQARYRDQRLGTAVEDAKAVGPETVAEVLAKLDQEQALVEARLEARLQDNPTATVEALADALVWHSNSEIAAKHLRQITFDYADQWGVMVDATDFSVGIDPDFDAVDAQNHAEAWRLHDRESSVMDIVSAMPLLAAAKGAVSEAISAWRGIGISPVDPRGHINDQAARRERLDTDLAAVKLPEADRARVSFVVDYLRGNTADVDLLYSPVLVDPGEEARGRVPRLLEAFTTNPTAGPLVREEIKVMTPADQDRVRQAGTQIARGGEVDVKLWPGYVDRYDLGEELCDYADEVDELATLADYLASEDYFLPEERERLGAVTSDNAAGSIRDDVNVQITRMSEQREQLRVMIHDGKGLAAVERAQLAAVLADIDTGRIRGHKQLPELLFADEKTKADADVKRVGVPASKLSTATQEAVTQRIAASGAAPQSWDSAERLERTVSAIGDSLYTVACGARGSGGIEFERKNYANKYASLGRQLVEMGAGEVARTEIGQLLADRARQAGELGRTAAWREQQWTAKVEAAVADRNDALAQRQAAAAGRAPNTGHARAPRTEKAAGEAHAQAQAQAQSSRAAAGRRQLHSPEVER